MINKKSLLILTILIIIGLILLFIFNNVSFETNNDNPTEYTPEEEISDKQLRETILTLYFKSAETGQIKSEGRLIDSTQLIKNPYLVIIQNLVDGPTSENLSKIFPEGTRILDAQLENNCIILNFSEEILNLENDEQGYLIINCILNSLTQLNEVNSIKFLVNGEKTDKFDEEYATI